MLHVFAALYQTPSQPPPKPPRETILLNELFRDYLRFNGYAATLSVFLAETAQPPEPALDRKFLAKEIGITETLRVGHGQSPASTSGVAAPGIGDLPLAYGLLAGYTQVRDMQRTLAPLVQRQHALAATSRYPHATPETSLPPPLPQHLQQLQSSRQHQYTSTQYSQSNNPKRTVDTGRPLTSHTHREGTSRRSQPLPQRRQEQQQQEQGAPTSLYDDHNYGSNLAPAATSAFAPLRTDDLRGVTGSTLVGWPSAESAYESEVNDDAGSGYGSYGNGSGERSGSGYGSSRRGSEGKTPSPPLAEANQGHATSGSVASDSDIRAAASTPLPESPHESEQENKCSEEAARDNGPTGAVGDGGLLVIDGAGKEDTKDIAIATESAAFPSEA